MPIAEIDEWCYTRITEVITNCQDDDLAGQVSESLIRVAVHAPKNFEKYAGMYQAAIRKWKL